MIRNVIGRKLICCDYCEKTMIVPAHAGHETCPQCNFPANREPTPEEIKARDQQHQNIRRN